MLSDMEHWLGNLGLEKYLVVFTGAEIDFSTLSYLTDDDLKELGLPLGPRRKLGEAIKQLKERSGLSSAKFSATASDRIGAQDSVPLQPPEPTSAAERRHLTIMFVDLVGSTQMSTQIDVEDMREIITSYQNTVASMVESHDGFVAKFMGDGVLCYFGWPQANEDDAGRAVRAGLAIIAGVKLLSGPNGEQLSTRVGIASGVVVVGDLVGSGSSEEAAVVGETPNLAARLQGLAEPDQLVLPEETRSLLGNLFELKSLGAHNLKGIGQPVLAFVVTGESTRESRFEASHSGTLTPLVGRGQELRLMQETWNRVQSGSGQMILVSGEAGIGKSRLTRAMIDLIDVGDHTRINCHCSPYHSGSAFYPIIGQMILAAGIKPADDDSTRLDKLERMEGVDTDNIALLAALLGIDTGSRCGTLALTPQQQRSHTMRTLCQMIVQLSYDRPLLFVFEDLHWIDPTSLELLDIVLETIGQEKILILATARPTFEHGFGKHPSSKLIALNRLGGDQIQAIVERLTGGRVLPAEVLQLIVSRTDGVPLFVEELTKTILETGVLKVRGDNYILNGPLDSRAIPGTLHDSLMARLDRLQPIKAVAQTAACIGRKFDHRLLVSISPLPEAELTSALEGLIKAELVFRRGVPPEAHYLFNHALVRDAAYESLLKENRRATHRRILRSLEADGNATPEVLAWHAEAAGLTEQAIDLWEAASKAAIARPAFDEGISHLGHAIALLLPQTNDGTQAVLAKALRLQIQLGTVRFYRNGYGADETKAAFEHALCLADQIGATPLRVPVLYGLWVNKYVRAQHADALTLAESLLKLVESGTDCAPVMLANRLVGVSLSCQGRFVAAQQHLSCAYGMFDPVMHKGLANRFGQDLGVANCCYMALNLWALGETRQAITHMLEAEQAALVTGHINTICYMHCHAILLGLLTEEEVVVERHLAEMVALATEHKLMLWQCLGSLIQALMTAGAGDALGIDQFIAADTHYTASKSQVFLAQLRIQASYRALTQELVEKAQTLADMARILIDQTGETFVLAELCRLEGALALESDNQNGAETSLKEAVAVARNQGSKSMELRAAIDLANLWQSMGRTSEACTVLELAVEGITDGDCTKGSARARVFLGDHDKLKKSHR